MIRVTECPRDAMQGLSDFVPTSIKVKYLNALMQVGFSVLDCGSFVSPKAVPQMADTSIVLDQLEKNGKTELLVIVANKRGAEEAMNHSKVDWLGFPLSLSETFQIRNTNKGVDEAWRLVEELKHLTDIHQKQLRVYLSMGFGNPYGDEYSPDFVRSFVERLFDIGVSEIALSDTIGVGEPKVIERLFGELGKVFPLKQIGAHFHSTPSTAHDKMSAALNAGCELFDVALGGFGGCPMAKEELTGNIDTKILLEVLNKKGISHGLDEVSLSKVNPFFNQIFY